MFNLRRCVAAKSAQASGVLVTEFYHITKPYQGAFTHLFFNISFYLCYFIHFYSVFEYEFFSSAFHEKCSNSSCALKCLCNSFLLKCFFNEFLYLFVIYYYFVIKNKLLDRAQKNYFYKLAWNIKKKNILIIHKCF